METYLNRTFRLLDKSPGEAYPPRYFHAIVIAEDDKSVTYVEHGKQSVETPRAHFEELLDVETEAGQPYSPLPKKKAEPPKPAVKK